QLATAVRCNRSAPRLRIQEKDTSRPDNNVVHVPRARGNIVNDEVLIRQVSKLPANNRFPNGPPSRVLSLLLQRTDLPNGHLVRQAHRCQRQNSENNKPDSEHPSEEEPKKHPQNELAK